MLGEKRIIEVDIPDDDQKVTVNLSIKKSDKKRLKIIAMEKGVTASKLISDFISEAWEKI